MFEIEEADAGDRQMAGEESEASWGEVLRSLIQRRVGVPMLAVIDGNPGLRAALQIQWPQLATQRCTNHKLRNLLANAPAHLREELAEDYRRMIYADSREAVHNAHAAFLRKWRLRCKAVVSSLEEAGEELFTFLQFSKSRARRCVPPTPWSGSTKSFAAAPRPRLRYPARTVLLLLFGLLRSGQIVLRPLRMDGWQDIPKVIVKSQAA